MDLTVGSRRTSQLVFLQFNTVNDQRALHKIINEGLKEKRNYMTFTFLGLFFIAKAYNHGHKITSWSLFLEKAIQV